MCVVPAQLKLLHTTETTDKLLAYGPPQLLLSLLTDMAVACMLNYCCKLSHVLYECSGNQGFVVITFQDRTDSSGNEFRINA